MKISRYIDSKHEKNIHHIGLPQPSIHVGISPSNFNLFTTIASDNLIQLWDIRSPYTIARFSSHINRKELIK